MIPVHKIERAAACALVEWLTKRLRFSQHALTGPFARYSPCLGSVRGSLCGNVRCLLAKPLKSRDEWRKRLTSASAGGTARAILCAGIIVLDEVFRVDRFPQPDAKTQAQSFFIVNGGCAANAAVAIARLGGRAALAGPLGEDSNGDRVLAALAREEIDCTGCQRLAGVPTALSAIFIDARGDRMIVTYCDDRLAAATPADAADLVAGADAVVADNRFPEFVRPICVAARARGLTVVLDADRPTQTSDELFRIATHVVFSADCLRATTGLDDLGAALAAIAGTTSSFLAVTQGPQDVLWRERSEEHTSELQSLAYLVCRLLLE